MLLWPIRMGLRVLVLMALLVGPSFAKYEIHDSPQKLVVGGDAGWRIGYDYKSWGAEVPVHVGDTLEFDYPVGEHTVTLLKDRIAFDNCDTSDPIAVYDGGKTEIKMDKPGWVFFVDGYADDCQQGVKMAINVLPAP